MCGLAGTLICGTLDETRLERVREIFTQNLLANEERGKDATGVAAMDREGRVCLHKAAVPASAFIRQEGFLHFMAECITPRTTMILGHTRLPTKGEPENNSNNHPIAVGRVTGIHNGTITNDDDIFRALTEGHRLENGRIGSVDSEAIFTLIDHIDPGLPLEAYMRELQAAAGRLAGSYASLFFNRARPFELFLLKYETPISVHYAEDLQALFFSSRYLFLRKAFGRSVITEALPNKTAYAFDARDLCALHKTPKAQMPLADPLPAPELRP